MKDQDSDTSPAPATRNARQDTVLDWARDAGASEILEDGLNRLLLRRKRRRLAVAAACAVLLAGGLSSIALREAGAPSTQANARATVLRPEQRILEDGTSIDLNAGAEIEVALSDSLRHVVLRQGEAHFAVAKDPRRPFVVTAGPVEVRAVGTAFVVDVGGGDINVLVTEGEVAVKPSPAGEARRTESDYRPEQPAAALSAGNRIVFGDVTSASGLPAGLVSEVSAAEMQVRLGWRVPRLKFSATPLVEVIAMFNEHAAGRDSRLVLAPDIPDHVHVSGILRADDVESLLRLLAGEFGISAERHSNEIVLRWQ